MNFYYSKKFNFSFIIKDIYSDNMTEIEPQVELHVVPQVEQQVVPQVEPIDDVIEQLN